MLELTEEQCNTYRRMRLTFDDMLRQVYKDGYNQAVKDLEHFEDTGVVIL
jgi:hypothetical protein